MRWRWGLVVAEALVVVVITSASGLAVGREVRAVGSARRSAASGSFVSLAQVRGRTVIERFALRGGRRLGVLARVPALNGDFGDGGMSEPHVTSTGSYVITLWGAVRCERAPSSECIPFRPYTCASRIENLSPGSHRFRTLVAEPRDKLVEDAVPSPDGRFFALVGGGCSTKGPPIMIRARRSGREYGLRTRFDPCGAPTVAWSSDGGRLVFVSEVGHRPTGGPCWLGVVSTRRSSSKSRVRFVAPDAGCSFRSAAFDAEGIAATEVCGPLQHGGTSKLLQLNAHRRVITRINLPRAQPQRGPYINEGATVVNDVQANTVLVSQDLPGPPAPVTRIWTFDGARLHLIRRFINNPVVAQP